MGVGEFDWPTWEKRQRAALDAIPGGSAVMEHFGFVPSFHDAEILRLDLQRDKPSTIQVFTWKSDPDVDPCLFTITIGTLVDLLLDGFSIQNVVYEIAFEMAAPSQPDRTNFYFATGRPQDEVGITFGPCYGVDGFIRALDVSLSVEPLPRSLSPSPRPHSP